jgi:hypothetical protein
VQKEMQMSDDKPMTEEGIAAARALDAARTPGRWEWCTSNSFRRLTAEGGRDGGVLCGDVQKHDGQPDVVCKESDRAFIAACSTLVPRLLREVDRLNAAAKILADQNRRYDRWRIDAINEREEVVEERDDANAEIRRLTADLGHVEPAEEPIHPVLLTRDHPCDCCGATLLAGSDVAHFDGEEPEDTAVMHWGQCPEPGPCRLRYVGSRGEPMRTDLLTEPRALILSIALHDCGAVTDIRLVRVRKDAPRG